MSALQYRGCLAWSALASTLLLGTGSARAAEPVNYADPATWLCRPDAADPCAQTLTSTVIAADGSQTKVSYAPNPAAPIDCFYVYPTTSHQPTPNADMALEDAEKRVAENQFARFATACRPFAPLYRQVTLAGLAAILAGDKSAADRELPYRDIVAAWRYYLEHDNHGRGVVLIGHSQGSRVLLQLLHDEIDGEPIQKQLVSAILPGTDVEVPKDALVGGILRHIPLCTSGDETGCVIAYSSYLASDPAGENAHFGSAETPDMVYGCVNPGALTGGMLDPELPAIGRISRSFGTNLVKNPGLISARCVVESGHSYLAISVGGDIRGAAVLAGLMYVDARRPGWGLHAVDLNLALGNLVEIVGREAKAWTAQNR